MSFLNDLRDRLRAGPGLYTTLAFVVLFVILVGYFIFVNSSITPAWRERNELAAQLEFAEGQLVAAQRAQDEEPAQLEQQIATAQARLDETANFFLSESQAAEILNTLYQYASESGVEITDLQTQEVDAGPGEKSFYDARSFQLQVRGAFPRLTNFVSRIREAAARSVIINDVNVVQGEQQHVLTLDIALYTSPYASESGGQVPDLTPSPPPQDVTQLATALDTAWAAGQWEQAINLINQLLALDPTYDDALEKLYVAYVNDGYRLLGAGNAEAAVAQFNAALAIKPDGQEAQAGLQSAIATPTPTLTAEEQLAHSLDQLWAQQNWPEVIRVIEQILALNPNYDGMTAKLYAAHVNYGYQLAAENKLEQAKEAFIRALDIRPDGTEAIAGLQALAEGTLPATPVPTSAYVTYVVQRGDTLFSISRRYGSTVQAIMDANGLTDFNIRVGQTLRIPVQQ
jgi:LysM repeat protein/Tfp pilus assembly protein PilO